MNQRRYLGIDLSGAKNSKTCLSVLEYFPKEKKVFLLDVHPGIGTDGSTDSDQVLIDTILDHIENKSEVLIGVDAPLSLPPCIACNAKKCAQNQECSSREVKWMRTLMQRQIPSKKKSKKNRILPSFTPYTQRPIELWLRHEVLAKIPERLRFEIDETLGGNRAPLAARMHYLKRHLNKVSFIEVLPKLTVALLMIKLKLNWRTLRQYRQIEDGAYARQTILDRMSENLDIFMYDRDVKKLTQNLAAFDSFLCAYTALLFDRNDCASIPKGFPGDHASGWIEYPNEVRAFEKASINDPILAEEET